MTPYDATCDMQPVQCPVVCGARFRVRNERIGIRGLWSASAIIELVELMRKICGSRRSPHKVVHTMPDGPDVHSLVTVSQFFVCKAPRAFPTTSADNDGFQCLLCANKYTYIQVRVPVFPVLSSVLIGPTSALSDGCSPHVRSTLMFLGWLGFSSNR